MELTIYNRTNQDMGSFTALFETIAVAAEKKLKLPRDHTLSVTFVRSRTIHTINRDYRGIDRPTDVITFAAQDESVAKMQKKSKSISLAKAERLSPW